MGGNSHDGARPVAGKHVFRNPDGDFFTGQRIDAVGTGENARNRLAGDPFAFGFLLHLLQVSLNGRFLGSRCQFFHPFAFRSQDHEGDAEDRVGPGGEDGDIVLLAVAGHFEDHFGPFAATDPVALHFLEGVRPVQVLQAVQQA